MELLLVVDLLFYDLASAVCLVLLFLLQDINIMDGMNK